MNISLKLVLLVLFCALLGAVGQTFFKLGSKTFSLSIDGFLLNIKFLIGLALYGVATVLFVFALKQGELSMLYPVIATSYIWVTILAAVFLHETVSILNIAGVFLIVLGVALVVI